MGSCKAPHVLVFPFPAQGHVNGSMDMSRKLALHGVSITFVCTEAYIASIMKQGFDAEGLPIRLLGLLREKSMTDTLDQVDVLIRVTESMGPALEDLLNKLISEGDRPACIVYDFMLWWVGRIGKELHIPAYIFFPMSASFYSYLINIPSFVSQGRLPLGANTDVSDKSNMFKIAGFPSLHVSEVPDISWDPNPVCSFEFVLRCATRWRDATGMLLNTVYELEEEVIGGLREKAPEMDIRAVGPILPSSFLRGEMSGDWSGVSAEAWGCLEWLDEQEAASVMYIAFGTIACLCEEQLQELGMGLEASEQRFVWVVRITDQKMKGVGLPSGFEKRMRGRGVVLWELAPQRKILAHKAIGGFLTHCGWNSTLEGLCKGLPMLCCPMFADQGMNGKWVEEMLQSGKLLKRSEQNIVRKEEVEVMVRGVMHHATPFRLSASRIRDLAAHAALHPAGSSHKSLHTFVRTLFNQLI